MNVVFKLRVQGKGQSVLGVLKLPLEMLGPPTKALSIMCLIVEVNESHQAFMSVVFPSGVEKYDQSSLGVLKLPLETLGTPAKALSVVVCLIVEMNEGIQTFMSVVFMFIVQRKAHSNYGVLKVTPGNAPSLLR